MWGIKVMAAVIAMTLTGCIFDDDVEVYIDKSLNEDEAAQVRNAAEAWNVRTNYRIDLGESHSDWIVMKAETPDDHYGYAQSRRKIIRISPSTPPEQVYAVALHEFGHAIGLGHTSRGVMDPARQTVEFSWEDMAECRDVGACD